MATRIPDSGGGNRKLGPGDVRGGFYDAGSIGTFTGIQPDSHSLEVTPTGIIGRAKWAIGELSGSDDFERLIKAAQHRAIPRLGALEPKLRIPVTSIVAKQVDGQPTVATVEVTWGTPQGDGGFINDPDDPEAVPTIEIDTILEPHETAFDADGNLIETSTFYEQRKIFDEDGNHIGNEAVNVGTQTARLEILLPATTIVYRRLERESPGLWKAPRFNGRVNGSVVFGDPAHFWLCRIRGDSEDDGRTWKVTYVFKRNVFSWLGLVVYRDKDDKPGNGVTLPSSKTPNATGNGSKYVPVYKADDFRELGLPNFLFGPEG